MTSGGATHSGRTLPEGLRAFRHRNFRLFWFGQLISLVGTWMQTVAQAWLILQLTNDAVALGLLAAVQFLPVMILGLFGGVVADALPKRKSLLVTQSAAALLALVLGLLVLTDTVKVWEVFVLAALLGVVNAFDMPIRQSFVVEMVGREDVANAVALNSAVFNGSRIIGPAVAGILIATVGIAICFLINAASYLAVLVGLLLMRTSELWPSRVATLERRAGAVVDHLVEGLRYVRNTPEILIPITVIGVVSTVAINFQVLLPLLTQDVLGGGPGTYGFLSAASGVGSLVAALMIAFGQRPTMRLLLTGATVIGVTMIGLGVSKLLLVSMLLMVACGWGLIAMAATTNTIIQLAVPDQLRGRAMSVYTTVFAGSTPIGGLFAGAIAATAGTPAAFVAAGVISIATAAGAAFWWSRVRHRAIAASRAEVEQADRTAAEEAVAMSARSGR